MALVREQSIRQNTEKVSLRSGWVEDPSRRAELLPTLQRVSEMTAHHGSVPEAPTPSILSVFPAVSVTVFPIPFALSVRTSEMQQGWNQSIGTPKLPHYGNMKEHKPTIIFIPSEMWKSHHFQIYHHASD